MSTSSRNMLSITTLTRSWPIRGLHAWRDTADRSRRPLDTLRDYGRDRLAELGETTIVRRKHLHYYRHLAAQAEAVPQRGGDRVPRSDVEDHRDGLVGFATAQVVQQERSARIVFPEPGRPSTTR
ncbi:hypothetical protein FDZ84_25105 [Saccharopolyspora sp. ASAGF58]|nr:hypothetical protein FDZ84_25105 [Saccharopolyspora sp. ASAGF58]